MEGGVITLQLKNITKTYGHAAPILNDLNVDISEKEIIGLIGKNGSGKSTLLKIINGLEQPDQGQIIFNQREIYSLHAKEQLNVRKKMAYIFQHFNLLDNKSVYYHLSLVYKLSNQRVDQQKIDEILAFMQLTQQKNQLCERLSGGQKQKVAIAMAILQEPEIILCDEISSALDNAIEKEIFALLMKLADEKNITLIIVSHNLSILKNYCTRILFLEDGRIRDEFIPKKSELSKEDDYFRYVKEFMSHD